MFCSKCGAEIKNEGSFCTNCGGEIKHNDTVKHFTGRESAKRKLPYIIIGLLLMLCAGLAGYSYKGIIIGNADQSSPSSATFSTGPALNATSSHVDTSSTAKPSNNNESPALSSKSADVPDVHNPAFQETIKAVVNAQMAALIMTEKDYDMTHLSETVKINSRYWKYTEQFEIGPLKSSQSTKDITIKKVTFSNFRFNGNNIDVDLDLVLDQITKDRYGTVVKQYINDRGSLTYRLEKQSDGTWKIIDQPR